MTAETVIATLVLTGVAVAVIVGIIWRSDTQLRHREAALLGRCESLSADELLAKFNEAEQRRAEDFRRYADELLAAELPDESEDAAVIADGGSSTPHATGSG